ncbi:hypothetical protein LCGC14_0987270 [marine sediment metagenome]
MASRQAKSLQAAIEQIQAAENRWHEDGGARLQDDELTRILTTLAEAVVAERVTHKLIHKIEEIEYHRNGVSGEGFHVVTFQQHPERTKMVGIVFLGRDRVAVFDRELLGRGVIQIGLPDDGGNSWHGDQFEPELRAAIHKFD